MNSLDNAAVHRMATVQRVSKNHGVSEILAVPQNQTKMYGISLLLLLKRSALYRWII